MNADNLKCHDCGDPLYKHPIESSHGPEGCQEGQLSVLLHHLEAAQAERDAARIKPEYIAPCTCGSTKIVEMDSGTGDHWMECLACGVRGLLSFTPRLAWNSTRAPQSPAPLAEGGEVAIGYCAGQLHSPKPPSEQIATLQAEVDKLKAELLAAKNQGADMLLDKIGEMVELKAENARLWDDNKLQHDNVGGALKLVGILRAQLAACQEQRDGVLEDVVNALKHGECGDGCAP